MNYYFQFLPLILISFLLSGCSSNDDNFTIISVDLEFHRVGAVTPDNLNPFIVSATIKDGDIPVNQILQGIEIELSRGSRSTITENNGKYEFTVTPDQTGEYKITLSYKGLDTTRTALVLKSVHNGWDQPMSVSGLVNTEGYEDGITITPDGSYLFVQYGPIYASGIFLFHTPKTDGGCGGVRLFELPSGEIERCSHEWIDTPIGPISAPVRPGFFDGRIAGSTFLHNSVLYQFEVDTVPIFAPSTMFYGFKKQPNGTFTEPFYVAFNDENDAIINPFGLSFLLHGDDTSTITFSFNDPANSDTQDIMDIDIADSLDVYTSEIILGINNSLGTFIPSPPGFDTPVREGIFNSTLVNFGKTGPDGIAGTQGNSHLYAINDIIKSVWTDDEFDDDSDHGELSVYVIDSGEFPTGSWTKTALPSVINKPFPSKEVQPFFAGTGLYFARTSDIHLPEIFYSSYSGTDTSTDYQDENNWQTPQLLLGADQADNIGKIIAVGEPTIATVDGKTILYFVYGVIRGFDEDLNFPDINMQAGYIIKK